MTRRQERRGTAAQWTQANPVLASGELGVELPAEAGTGARAKIGDGVTAWALLPYTDTVRMVDGVLVDSDGDVIPLGDPLPEGVVVRDETGTVLLPASPYSVAGYPQGGVLLSPADDAGSTRAWRITTDGFLYLMHVDTDTGVERYLGGVQMIADPTGGPQLVPRLRFEQGEVWARSINVSGMITSMGVPPTEADFNNPGSVRVSPGAHGTPLIWIQTTTVDGFPQWTPLLMRDGTLAPQVVRKSGWRRLPTGSFPTAPGVYAEFQRNGNLVTLILDGPAPVYAVNGLVPAGFRPAIADPSTAPYIALPARTSNGADLLVIGGTSGDIETTFYGTIGNLYRATFVYETADPWPANLPGVAHPS